MPLLFASKVADSSGQTYLFAYRFTGNELLYIGLKSAWSLSKGSLEYIKAIDEEKKVHLEIRCTGLCRTSLHLLLSLCTRSLKISLKTQGTEREELDR